MTSNNVVIKVTPQGATQGPRIAVAKVFNMALLGLNVPELDLASLKFPITRVSINLHLSEGDDWNDSVVRAEFKRWVLTNAFRDLAKALNVMLEGVYAAVLPVRLGEQVSRNGVLTEPAWRSKNGELVSKKAKFHRGGLSDKFKALRDVGFPLQDAFMENVSSIQAARNCLAHRQGVVGAEDVNSDTTLTLHFKRIFPIVIVGGREEEIIAFPYQTSATEDTQISMRDDDTTKPFTVGERISFDAAEFGDLCWTLWRMSDYLEHRVAEYCQKRGGNFVNLNWEPSSLSTFTVNHSALREDVT